MKYFDGVIVVEGKGDVSFLSSFINSEYVILNGYEIPDHVVDYLGHISNRQILVLTDPDKAGEEIAKKLEMKNFNFIRRMVNASECNKHGKHGVAECSKKEILRVLSDLLIDESPFKISLTKSDFIELDLEKSSNKRELIAKEMHLGVCNSKTLFKRLNYNGITKKEIMALWR